MTVAIQFDTGADALETPSDAEVEAQERRGWFGARRHQFTCRIAKERGIDYMAASTIVDREYAFASEGARRY